MFAVEQSLVVEAKANTHLTHLEELVLTQGKEGYQLARPENGRFFVGTKSIFNKEPKINYTKEDVDKNHGHAPGLVDKLKKALDYLPSLGIKKILQGDFMFDDEMLEVTTIDGEPHYRFKPNTIVYAVPVNSEIGQEIGQSKFGIVFHTTYDSLDSGASYGADVSNLNRPPGIWFDDAFFTDDTGTVTLTENEEVAVRSLIKQSDTVDNKINYADLPSDFLNIYINSEIRGGQFLENPKESYEGFVNWYESRIEKRIDSLKTEKGKMRAFDQGQEKIKQFETKKGDILNLFKVSRLLFEAKNIFIAKYNNAVYNTRHFLDDGSGDLVATNPEGYVAVDVHGNGVKFVDRLEFSRANFLMDKGFKKDVNESQILEVFWGGSGYSVKMSLREWADKLPDTVSSNEDLYKKISAGIPITTLVMNGNKVKASLAEAVNWGLQMKCEGPLAWATDFIAKKYSKNEAAFDEGMIDDMEKGATEKAFNIVSKAFNKSVSSLKLEDAAPAGTILYLPGGFKPPHKGHFALVQDALDKNPGAKLVIMSGEGMRDNVSLAQSKKIWDIYLNAVGKGDKIEVRQLKKEPQYDEHGDPMQKPMRGAGVKEPIGGWPEDIDPRRRSIPKAKIVRDDDGEAVMLDISTESPINSIANAIRFTDKPKSAKIVASAADPNNANDISSYLNRLGLDVETEIVPVRVKSDTDDKMSATQMRRSVQQGIEAFTQFLPDELDDQEALEVFAILGGGLEEMSAMAGGAVALGVGQGRSEDDDDKNEQLVNEVANYLLGISVG